MTNTPRLLDIDELRRLDLILEATLAQLRHVKEHWLWDDDETVDAIKLAQDRLLIRQSENERRLRHMEKCAFVRMEEEQAVRDLVAAIQAAPSWTNNVPEALNNFIELAMGVGRIEYQISMTDRNKLKFELRRLHDSVVDLFLDKQM